MSDASILNQPRLPGRLTMSQTAALLGMEPHDVPVLVRARMLKPLGQPTPNAPKYFSAVEIEARARDEGWLDRATKTLSRHWQEKNQRRRKPDKIRTPVGSPHVTTQACLATIR